MYEEERDTYRDRYAPQQTGCVRTACRRDVLYI